VHTLYSLGAEVDVYESAYAPVDRASVDDALVVADVETPQPRQTAQRVDNHTELRVGECVT